jgi:UDP-N-acetylmuramoyl-tripeptide--D-alanyl-D-alanine ligase
MHGLKNLNALLLDEPFCSFSVDTRMLNRGDIYCALPGEKADGHLFVKEAFEKGAKGAIVLDSYQESALGPLFHVENVLNTLQNLAKEFLANNRPRLVIGVTGSLGKTTAKDFIATLLEGSFSVCKTPGNFNSQIGLPLTLLNHWKGEEVLVLEMGMTHPGNIRMLTEIAPPDIALLTTVSLVHAANFSSLEEIGRAKSEIFLHPRTKLGIYASEIDNVLDIKEIGSCNKRCFSLSDPSAYFQLKQEGQWIFKAGTAQISLGDIVLQGMPCYHNLLGALSVCHLAGVSEEKLASQINLLKVPKQRLEHVFKHEIYFINDAYNAAPDSVKAGMASLPQVKGKKIGVLGSMLELGRFSEESHRQVGEEALLHLDHLICFGSECAPMKAVWEKAEKPVELFYDLVPLLHYLRACAVPGDLVYIKGSNSKMMWKILDDYS